MPYAILEKEIQGLNEAQQNAVVLFVRFLLSQKAGNASTADSQSGVQSREKVSLFGAFKDKIKFIAPDFDEPLEDFAEYM